MWNNPGHYNHCGLPLPCGLFPTDLQASSSTRESGIGSKTLQDLETSSPAPAALLLMLLLLLVGNDGRGQHGLRKTLGEERDWDWLEVVAGGERR